MAFRPSGRTYRTPGQQGDFTLDINGMQVRIELDGMFGIGSTACPLPSFSARAVDVEQPFISETGFRSFLGLHAEPVPGMTTEDFVRAVIDRTISRELKGRLRRIEPEYRR